MVSRRDEQQRRGAGADPVQGQKAWGAGGNEGIDELIKALDLAAGNSARRPRSRTATRVA